MTMLKVFQQAMACRTAEALAREFDKVGWPKVDAGADCDLCGVDLIKRPMDWDYVLPGIAATLARARMRPGGAYEADPAKCGLQEKERLAEHRADKGTIFVSWGRVGETETLSFEITVNADDGAFNACPGDTGHKPATSGDDSGRTPGRCGPLHAPSG